MARLDRYRIGIHRGLSEIRTQPWLSEGSLTWYLNVFRTKNMLLLLVIYIDFKNYSLVSDIYKTPMWVRGGNEPNPVRSLMR